jgi:hypothetical protein
VLLVADILVDQCGRQVRNMLLLTNFGCLNCGAKHVGGGGAPRLKVMGEQFRLTSANAAQDQTTRWEALGGAGCVN